MELEEELYSLRQMKRNAEIKQKPIELASCCNSIGEILSKLGRHEEALREHKKELECSELTKGVKGSAIAHRKIGECYSELGNFAEALQHQNKHLELALQLNDYVEVQRAWATLGRTHFFQADVFKKESRAEFHEKAMDALKCAENAYTKALETCDKIGGDVEVKELALMRSRLYLNLGSVYDFRGDLDTCIRFMEKAININRNHKLMDELVQCHTSLSLSLSERSHGRLKEAREHANIAINISSEMKSKENECYSHFVCAQVLIEMMEFKQARKMLLKSYKIGSPNADQQKDTTNKLKKVIKLVDLQKKLNGGDAENQLKLYEKMGDLCSESEIFSPAIYFYQKTLECAKRLGKSQKEMGPIFSSLAQTYFDMKDFKRAKLYFLEELRCEKNAKEECQILLYLELCEENGGAGYKVLEEILRDASASAERANCPRLQMDCLQNLLKTQLAYGASEESVRKTELAISNLRKGHCDEMSCSQNSTCEDDESESDTSIHPSEYSDFSESGEEDETAKPKRTKAGSKLWRNEKGETALHVACIDGKLQTVAKLLEKGHVVNCHDNAGWSPLHEAANHDYVDIVEMLVERGAAIDDPGGPQCCGITPLLDAADNGHINTVKTLIRLGANIRARNSKGMNVVECLKKWRERALGDGADRDVIEAVKKFGKELKTKVAQGSKRTVANEKRWQDSCYDDEVGDYRVEIVDDDAVEEDIDEGSMDYFEESVPKRRCLDTNENPITLREMEDRAPRVPRRMRQSKMTTAMPPARTSPAGIFPKVRKANNTFLNAKTFNEGPSPEVTPRTSCIEVPAPVVETANLCAMRVKVKIQDKLILIPVLHSDVEKNVSWLCESAASRYESLFGPKPIITLSTRDGALLCGEDQLKFVIMSDEEVLGTVVSWHLPPLAERYATACKALGLGPRKDVKTALQGTNTVSCVMVEDLCLGPNIFAPICRALHGHATLTEITLSGNKLGDCGIELLVPVLSSIPHVRHLDLKCNNIGPSGVKSIWEMLYNVAQEMPTGWPLQRLEFLDLGYNPLRPSAHVHLAQICARLPALRRLHLSSCEITAGFFTDLDKVLRRNEWSVQELNVSLNDLATPGFEWPTALSLLNPCTVTKMDFGGTSAASLPTHGSAGHFCTALSHFLDQNGCAVTDLVVADCGLKEECVKYLVDMLSRTNFAPGLTAFDVQLNDQVGPRTAKDLAEVLSTRA